ncbi:hypothetical protein HNY73_008715 [Argiope bruennichi]|uniref:Uncharacterized protein n=1 Tax=Argiope bruennichi TaxID=94029 RepID=A0A8T0FA43_ARGBR|nr:hypothetical protein HNY73_008715 [Argiope bruennichi]
MRFVMREHRLKWVPADIVYFYRQTCLTKFNYAVGLAVIEMSGILRLQMKEKFKHMRETGFTSSKHFEMEMKNSAQREFVGGFNLRRFLVFCGMVTSLAVRFYLHGCSQAPYQAVAVIAEVMTDNKDRFIASGGWDALQAESVVILTGDNSACGCFSFFRLPHIRI